MPSSIKKSIKNSGKTSGKTSGKKLSPLANENGQALILKRICQAMLLVVCLQSYKLFFYHDLLTFLYPSPSLKHLLNLVVHLVLFCLSLTLLKCKYFEAAKLLLTFSFCSFIGIACLLWAVNLHLQYYYLLSIFICSYLYSYHQQARFYLLLIMHSILFLYFQMNSPSLSTYLDTYASTYTGNYDFYTAEYLHLILMTNDAVFACSCIICALAIRRITSKNWQVIGQYQRKQSQILLKIFPEQLLPALVNAEAGDINPIDKLQKHGQLHENLYLGVIFVDICDFTAQTRLETQEQKDLHRQEIYQLYGDFDKILSQFKAKRIKTNGDQYILVLGLNRNTRNTQSLAEDTLVACQALQSASPHELKIGAALGNVTCGIFDPAVPNFDIWGETVIRAARLESLAGANEIKFDANIANQIQNKTHIFSYLDQELKGLGVHRVYSLKFT